MLNFGMPEGFGALLAQKYGLLGLTARANADESEARAGLTNTQNGLLPQTTAADIGKTQAETAGIQTNTRLQPYLAQSTIKLQGGQTAGAYAGANKDNAGANQITDDNKVRSFSGFGGFGM